MSIAINNIYCEDCLETMKKMSNDFVDLTVTSPPYDDLRSYKGYSFNFESIALELYRITKPNKVLVWIVGDATHNGSESGTSFKQALYFKDIGFNLHDTMIYHKENPPPVGGKNRYYQSFEYMFVLSKGRPDLNPIIVPRRNKHNDKRKTRWRGLHRSKDGEFVKKQIPIKEEVKKQNVWSYVVSGGSSTKDKIAHKHPAIYPEKMVHDHIVSWSNEGDLVYDPFSGSGTTAKMSFLSNRSYIGSEISKEYCEIAEKRLSRYKNSNDLFGNK